MKIDDFALAATTNDLGQEPKARDVADFIEFQMDGADEPLTQLTEYEGTLPIIATNRATWDTSEASDSDRLDELFSAAHSSAVEMIDVELSVLQQKEEIVEELHTNDVQLIVSYYNFEQTPDREELDDIVKRCAKYGDVAKISVFAEDQMDSLNLLEMVNNATEAGIQIAGISMGEAGRHTRIIAPFYGSKIGYAPISLENCEYAPGQIELLEFASLLKTVQEGGDDVELIDSLKGNFPPSKTD